MSAEVNARRALQVLLVDDEALARSRLQTLLNDCTHPRAHACAQAGNAVQAMEALHHGDVDVMLLDIHMPGADGVTLARSVSALPRPPAVIFVTAHAQHAVDAFELNAVDYLTKPVRLERLQTALQKAERMLLLRGGDQAVEIPEEVLVIQDRSRTERVPLSEVLYFKAELKYITVRTRKRSYIIDGALGDFEEKYAGQFMRVHRNALIAKRAARLLQKHHDSEEGDGWALRLDGLDELIFVSRRQLSAVREMLGAPRT
jgi:two-component system response regulator AlgR